MSPEFLVLSFLEYVVFLLSTTCHEAAHALAAKWGGDLTAFNGGQVSLNPMPHIRREPFGMVVVPLLGLFAGGALIGWASAPFDPRWQERYPKRAAWMSLAGPAANFTLAILALLLLRIGLLAGFFVPGFSGMHQMVAVPAGGGDITSGIATVLSIFLWLNLLLGTFNLLPVPPLDGYSVLGLFTSEKTAVRMQEFRMRSRGFAIIGIMVGWRVFEQFETPLYSAAIRLLYK